MATFIDKFVRKLSGWNQKVLCFAGRVCLINHILSSLVFFFFSFFKVPKKVGDILIKLERNFSWGVRKGREKYVGRVTCWVGEALKGRKMCIIHHFGGGT